MATQTDYQPINALIDVSIASGQTTSGAFNTGGATLCGIHMPAAFTGASLTFLAAPNLTGTYQTVQKNGVDLTITVTQGKYIALNPSDFAGTQFLKIVSASSEGSARTLTLAVRPV